MLLNVSGLVTKGSGGSGGPPGGGGTQAFLADEVSNDALLYGHDEVYWYPDFTSLATMLPYTPLLPTPFPSDNEFWFDTSSIPFTNVDGVAGAGKYGISSVIVAAPELGLNALRGGSQYLPDHINYNFTWTTVPPASKASGATWINLRKWTYQPLEASVISPKPSSASGWQSTPLRELWLRYMIYLESDILIGMTENNGTKLGGVRGTGLVGGVMWYMRPVDRGTSIEPGTVVTTIGERRFALKTYWETASPFNGDLLTWGSGPNSDQNVGAPHWVGNTQTNNPTSGHPGGTATRYIYPNTWHCIEQHFKCSSAAGVADGIRQVWFDDELLINHVNCITHNSGIASLAEIHCQVFHGGQTHAPSSQIHARTTAWAAASRRIGSPKMQPVLLQDLNANSWVGVWDQTQTRYNMEYSNCFQVPGTGTGNFGRQIEFSMAQHSRPPGDNVGVRWATFTSDLAPTGGYFTSNTDTQLQEGDNAPSAYLPWIDGAWLQHQKIVQNIQGSPTFLFKNNDGVNTTETFHPNFHEYDFEVGLAVAEARENYNPACLVNPASNATLTFFVGGGYEGNSYANGHDPTVKLIKQNPNYPATSTKPFILKMWKTHAPAPTHMRHMPRYGDWAYWGGTAVYEDGLESSHSRNNEFYRIKISDLAAGTYTQEAITPLPQPIVASHGLTIDGCVRFNLLCSDPFHAPDGVEKQRWLIFICIDGVYRYKIPDDDGNDGVWDGPYTFGLADWAATISDGQVTSNWHGVIGTHWQGMRRTFFRYNLSKRWHVIDWGVR